MYVQESMGHATIFITVDTCSRALPEMNGGLANAMEEEDALR